MRGTSKSTAVAECYHSHCNQPMPKLKDTKRQKFRILFNTMNRTTYKAILKESITEQELEQAENCIFFTEEPSHIS